MMSLKRVSTMTLAAFIKPVLAGIRLVVSVGSVRAVIADNALSGLLIQFNRQEDAAFFPCP